MYRNWNDRLFEHFFNEDKTDKQVTLYVDKSFLDEIGKDLGGIDVFVESIVYVDGECLHLVDRFGQLVEATETQSEIPPYFGVLCLTILAWTVDSSLNAANFYDRLNGLTRTAYTKHLNQEYILNYCSIGKGVYQVQDAKFRALLDRGFDQLTEYVNKKLDGRKGVLLQRKVGDNYVDIPRAHALVNARDRNGLEKLFFERGLKPGLSITTENAEYLMENAGGIGLISGATRRRWVSGKENRVVICEIICSLLEYWDGEYIDDFHENSSFTKGNKVAAAYITPCFKPSVFGGSYSLQSRVEFYNSDFPVDTQVNYAIGENNYVAERQYQGWSSLGDYHQDIWTLLLDNSSSNPVYIASQYRIRFLHKSIYFLEVSSELGGYIPIQEVSPDRSYLIFLNEERSRDLYRFRYARWMTRTRAAGCQGQKISVEQALRAYTYEAAFASFEEDRKGRLKPGMLADMVLIDRDLTTIEPEAIRDAKVLKTIVGGRVVFSGLDYQAAVHD